MAERLAGGNTAIAMLANTIATGAALAALILTLSVNEYAWQEFDYFNHGLRPREREPPHLSRPGRKDSPGL
jgi:hypothetical protein